MAKQAAYGTKLAVQYAQAGAYTDLIFIGDLSGPEVMAETIDVSTHDSPDHFNEFLMGHADGGEITFDVEFDASNVEHAKLFNAVAERIKHNFYLKLPGWVSTAAGGYWAFAGFFTKFSPTLGVKTSVRASMTVKVSGKPVFTGFTGGGLVTRDGIDLPGTLPGPGAPVIGGTLPTEPEITPLPSPGGPEDTGGTLPDPGAPNIGGTLPTRPEGGTLPTVPA